MPNKYQKYEAAVKLNNNSVVTYHNINTGLKKFHKFIVSKFDNNWTYYTVRRIINKEIIDTYVNSVTSSTRAYKLFLPKQRNEKDSGYFVRFPFLYNNITINRNLFFSDKVILKANDEWIIISDEILNKAISQSIIDLTEYYHNKGHNVFANEFLVGNFANEKVIIEVKTTSTEPLLDYP